MIRMLNTRCNVLRRTAGARNAMNEPAQTWATTTTGAPCRLEGANGREVISGKQVVLATHIVYALTSLDVAEKDKIVIGVREFEVTYVNTEPGGVSNHHIEIACVEVRV